MTLLAVFLLVYPISFISIYSHKHSRVQASEWIYENVPKGSMILCEHWDDCLPLSLDDKSPHEYQYKVEYMELYYPDSDGNKWPKINSQLAKADYIIMSSNRLWGSIPRAPDRYPETIKYYQNLFDEKLGYTKIHESNSYPCFPPIGKAWFCVPDQSADESFTVYDHPLVLIYQKKPSS